jgi:hypothetical protein
MSLSFDDNEKHIDATDRDPVTKSPKKEEFSADAIDAELRSLNIRPTKRRRRAMRSWLAIEVRKGLCIAIVALSCSALLSTLSLAGATPAEARTISPSGRYLTILLAHSAETAVDSQCHPLPNVVTLEQQATAFAARGIHGVTGTVITSWPQQQRTRASRASR